MLTHGSLFAGIGGFDLGFERAGIKTLWQVENDPYCLRVLERHSPNIQRYGDIKEIEWEDVEVPDIVSGGFPCQPVSVAGKRKGTEDERWLWPEFARCLRVLRPRYVVLENVPGILALGFGDVLGDLAALGYDAEWDCIPAAAFGAPHLRYRVWVMAYTDNERRTGPIAEQRPRKTILPRSRPVLADADGSGRQGRAGQPTGRRVELEDGGKMADASSIRLRKSPCPEVKKGQTNTRPEYSGVLSGGFERCSCWAVEPNVGRVADGVPARVDRLKCLGNSIVPQVANWLAKRILDFEKSRVY